MGISSSSLNLKVNIYDNNNKRDGFNPSSATGSFLSRGEGFDSICYFFPGNTVRGEVIIDVTSATCLTAGTVSLVAEERVRATTGVIAGQASYTQTHSKTHSFFKETLVLFGPSAPSDRSPSSRKPQHGNIVPQGCYRYPFQFRLPLELPSGTNRLSSRSQRISVNYHIHAKLYRTEKIPSFFSTPSQLSRHASESGFRVLGSPTPSGSAQWPDMGHGSGSDDELVHTSTGSNRDAQAEEEEREEQEQENQNIFECQREIMVVVPVSVHRMVSERGFANQKKIALYRSSGSHQHRSDGGHVMMTLGTRRRFFSGGGDTIIARLRIDNSQGKVKIDHITIECYPKADFVVPDYSDVSFKSRKKKPQQRALPAAYSGTEQTTTGSRAASPGPEMPRLMTVPSLSELAEMSFGKAKENKQTAKRALSHVEGSSLIQLKLKVDVPAGADDITIPFSVPLPHHIDVCSYPSQGYSHTFRHELSISIPNAKDVVSVPLYVAKAAYDADHPDLASDIHPSDRNENDTEGDEDEDEEGCPFPFIPNNVCIFGIPQHRIFNFDERQKHQQQPSKNGGSVLMDSKSLRSRPLPEHLEFQPVDDNSIAVTPSPRVSADGRHKPLDLSSLGKLLNS